jgi:hypothetical protein
VAHKENDESYIQQSRCDVKPGPDGGCGEAEELSTSGQKDEFKNDTYRRQKGASSVISEGERWCARLRPYRQSSKCGQTAGHIIITMTVVVAIKWGT